MFVRVNFEVTILTIHDHLERDSSLATRRNLRLLTEVEVKFNGTRGSLDARHPVVGRDEANLVNGKLTRIIETGHRLLPEWAGGLCSYGSYCGCG